MQTSTFGAEFTAVENEVMLIYHLRYMGVKITNPSPIFVDNMSVVLNEKNAGISLNRKTV